LTSLRKLDLRWNNLEKPPRCLEALINEVVSSIYKVSFGAMLVGSSAGVMARLSPAGCHVFLFFGNVGQVLIFF
jgi:hypothetical protein